MFPQPTSDDPQTHSAAECVPFRRFSFTGLISGADSHPRVKCADGFSLCLISLIVVREQRGVGAEGRGVAQREETNEGMQRGLQQQQQQRPRRWRRCRVSGWVPAEGVPECSQAECVALRGMPAARREAFTTQIVIERKQGPAARPLVSSPSAAPTCQTLPLIYRPLRHAATLGDAYR